jgi:hypothetical protein
MICFIYLFCVLFTCLFTSDDGPRTETCILTRQIERIDISYVAYLIYSIKTDLFRSSVDGPNTIDRLYIYLIRTIEHVFIYT